MFPWWDIGTCCFLCLEPSTPDICMAFSFPTFNSLLKWIFFFSNSFPDHHFKNFHSTLTLASSSLKFIFIQLVTIWHSIILYFHLINFKLLEGVLSVWSSAESWTLPPKPGSHRRLSVDSIECVNEVMNKWTLIEGLKPQLDKEFEGQATQVLQVTSFFLSA